MTRNHSLIFSTLFLWLATLAFSAQAVAKTPVVMLPDFSVLAEQSSPVVVNISTTKSVGQSIPKQFKGIPDDMLRFFFGLPPGADPKKQGSKQKVRSLGSGFVIGSDGYIVTNNHVIAGAEDIVVKLSNRKEYKAKLVGTDVRTDIALLKIDAKGLKAAKIGSNKTLKVGQWVLAIGEPFGLDYTVTHGIVSALGRSLPDDTYVPFIQTDVPINPGNSGGPLFNMSGEVVGVNSQIYSKGGGSVGLSFSIPIDIAMHVVKQLKKQGKVTRGYLGVSVQEVPPGLAKSFGLKEPRGALIAEVLPDSPAVKYGLKDGDIILEFDHKKIKRSSDLPPIVGTTAINEAIPLKLLRQGKIKVISIKLVSLNKAISLAEGQDEELLMGLKVAPMPPEKLKELNLPFGLLVTEVVNKGAAQRAGIRAGDILVSVNFQSVSSIKVLREIAKKLPKDRAVPVRIVRDKRSVFLPLSLGK